jgi:hypothetical protein
VTLLALSRAALSLQASLTLLRHLRAKHQLNANDPAYPASVSKGPKGPNVNLVGVEGCPMGKQAFHTNSRSSLLSHLLKKHGVFKQAAERMLSAKGNGGGSVDRSVSRSSRH